MEKPLTPFEYFMLTRMMAKCEITLQDPFLRTHTNVEDIYQCVMEQIIYETESILQKEVYSNPLILKPASNA